ncbi:DNA polymerase, partial [Pseudomonas aeruginosa]|uniref:DNA polymerase n=1 Tax=Pseudomonas aeruginosa TaxID=287 RepID=UPI0024B24E57
ALVAAIRLDIQSRELGEKMVALEDQAYDLAGQDFNLASPDQPGAILYAKLGLPVLSKTAPDQPSTAEAVLAELAEQDSELPKV